MPEMIAAINQYIEKYNLGPVLSGTLMCIQTDSEKTKKSLFGGVEKVQTGAILTPHWLFWATTGTKMKSTVLAAQLKDVVVQDYAQTSFMKMIPDSGINVSGKFTDISENISAFIGLEDNAVGNKFTEIVIQAAQDAKK
jgi:hypothetical protein